MYEPTFNLFILLANPMTIHPLLANSFDSAAPIPELAPVTTAILFMYFSILSELHHT